MSDRRNWYRSLYSTAILIALASTARAAVFEMETLVGPEAATTPQEATAGCESDAFADGVAEVTNDGRRVIVLANARASIAGDACSDEVSQGQAWGVSGGTLTGDAGESVLVCARARALQNADVEGTGFDAESALGGGFTYPPPLPMELRVNGSAVFSFGPNIIDDTGSASESFLEEFELTVGDTIEMRAFAQATTVADAGGPHSGAATARARGELVLTIGGCDGVMAPTATPLGLSLLIACLAVLGALRAAPRLQP